MPNAPNAAAAPAIPEAPGPVIPEAAANIINAPADPMEAPPVAQPMPPANPQVDICWKANTTYQLSTLSQDGIDLKTIAPCIVASTRCEAIMLTFPRERKEFAATREERIAAKKTKPEDFKDDPQKIVDLAKDFLASKPTPVALRRAVVAFEKHAWIDPQSETFADHIHFVFVATASFAWYNFSFSHSQNLFKIKINLI